jgi:hypothetical protein
LRSSVPGLAQQRVRAAQQRDALGTRQRLDAPHVRGRRRLGRQLEHADLGGRAHMGAAAQLARPRAVADLHDPDDVAVLLAEQRHGAQAPRLVERHRQRADRLVERDLGVDAVLHVPDVLVAQRGAVGEVEAQLVRADVRTGLAHVRAQALAQRGVQQVRGRVVALGGVADRRRHTRDHPRALASSAPRSTSSTTAWSSPSRRTSATRAAQSPDSH